MPILYVACKVNDRTDEQKSLINVRGIVKKTSLPRLCFFVVVFFFSAASQDAVFLASHVIFSLFSLFLFL